MGVEGSGARELLRSLAGLETCTGTIEIGGVSGAAALDALTRLRARRRGSSASIRNFSVGENLLVRLGAPADRRRRLRAEEARA